ncbi:NAD-binding protein [Hamadaea sp. NPDC050747]|uniref:NAD-binding protein n=1 Tax=Hamadaea sp. NPDC050747 TaxID=3155789 RepID=UPI0033F89532
MFARIATAVDNAKGRRMNGTVALREQDHLVIVGYHPGRTERIVAEVLADTHGRKLVLCAAPDTTVNPMPGQPVGFVRGDFTDDVTLRRACVHTAATVVIDAADDNEALAVLVTVAHLTATAHVVVALRDMERAAHLTYVHPGVNCVQWHHPRMLAEELQDPGMARIYGELMSSDGGNTYSIRLPHQLDQTSFGACQVILGQRHDAVLLAVETDGQLLISPSWHHQLTAGATLFYVGRRRLSPADLSE